MGEAPMIADRLIKQMNSNGDERIDHNEFVGFFMKLLMGPIEKRMEIAWRIFDFDNDENLTQDEIMVVMKNIPIIFLPRVNQNDYMSA